MAECSVTEAAKVLGVSDDTVRRRLERGDLLGRRKRSGRWTVVLPDPLPQKPAAAPQAAASSPHTAAADPAGSTAPSPQPDAPPPQNPAEITHLRELVADLRRNREFLEGQVQTLQQQLTEAGRERAELRMLLAAFAQRLPELPPHAEPRTITSRPWWQRLAFWRS